MLDRDDLDKLVRAVAETRESEIGCDECFEQMDRFAEIEFSGSDAASAMPLVHDHLSKCEDCREVYEALLIAIGRERVRSWSAGWSIYARTPNKDERREVTQEVRRKHVP
jgi:predicted anti-sigma-YlaC factor YlaD